MLNPIVEVHPNLHLQSLLTTINTRVKVTKLQGLLSHAENLYRVNATGVKIGWICSIYGIIGQVTRQISPLQKRTCQLSYLPVELQSYSHISCKCSSKLLTYVAELLNTNRLRSSPIGPMYQKPVRSWNPALEANRASLGRFEWPAICQQKIALTLSCWWPLL